MHRATLTTSILLPSLLLGGTVAFGQPADDDEVKKWAEDLDRPLARALAYERRDVVRELLESPGSLKAADPAILAAEVGIPKEHAKQLIEAVRNGTSTAKITHLLKAGLPQGFSAPESLGLKSATQAQLEAAGMTKAQAESFVRFRNSTQRAWRHFREIRAINEAKARATADAAKHTRTMAGKVKKIAETLGLKAEALKTASGTDPIARARARARIASEAAAEVKSTLHEFRRADGTLDWNKATKSEVLRGGSGLMHFGLALFMKELAVTLQTGDKSRMKEFLNGLTDTDFYVNYGLFSAGARAADVAYGRYVRRLSRKSFVSGVVRSNIVLAAGLAVPMAVQGQFDLNTYIVDVAALGISATAVKAAVEGGKGLWKLVRGGRSAINLGRLAGPVGWVATAGETAVVLLAGDYLAKQFDTWASKKKIKENIDKSEKHLNGLLNKLRSGESVLPDELSVAVRRVEEAYDDERRHRIRPVEERMGRFHEAMNGASVTALKDETSLNALESRLENNPGIATRLAERHGTAEKAVEAMRAKKEKELEARLLEVSNQLKAEFAALLKETYEGKTTAADPAPQPGSRMASYDTETDSLLKALDATTDPEARKHIALAIERVRAARTMDRTVLEAGVENE